MHLLSRQHLSIDAGQSNAMRKSENVFAFSGPHAGLSSVPSCHHVESIDIFSEMAYACCSANPPREFAVAASNNFNYGLLPREREAHLRHLATTIHNLGCKQTAEGVAIGKMLIEAKADFKMLIEPKAGFKRGQFSEWCESEAGYRKRRAELLMSLANFAVKEPEVLRIPLSAGYLLAAPSAPQHVIQLVLSVAKDGGRVKVSWVEMLLEEANKKQSEPERRSMSEVTKIAKLIAGALGPSQTTTLRKLLEAAGAALTQRFVCGLQAQLQDELRGIAPSSEQSGDQQLVAL